MEHKKLSIRRRRISGLAVLQYNKDSGDIYLFLRQARGLVPKSYNIYYRIYFALVQNTSQNKRRYKIAFNKKGPGARTRKYSILNIIYWPWFKPRIHNKEIRHRNTRGFDKKLRKIYPEALQYRLCLQHTRYNY